MVGKMMLPFLGGAASVWITCLLFFQLMLLAGYGYAHVLERLAAVRTQVLVHCLMLLAEVYAAGEAPIVAADGRALARALRASSQIEPIFVESIADMPATILKVARDGDVVLTMGAGSIGGVPHQLTQLQKVTQ